MLRTSLDMIIMRLLLSHVLNESNRVLRSIDYSLSKHSQCANELISMRFDSKAFYSTCDIPIMSTNEVWLTTFDGRVTLNTSPNIVVKP